MLPLRVFATLLVGCCYDETNAESFDLGLDFGLELRRIHKMLNSAFVSFFYKPLLLSHRLLLCQIAALSLTCLFALSHVLRVLGLTVVA